MRHSSSMLVGRVQLSLTSLAIAGCIGCDSGPAKVAPTPPDPAPATPAATQNQSADGQPSCRFQRPEVWVAGRAEWLGACTDGVAEGSGVIVQVVEGAEPERFYGQLESGSPSLGVVQTSGGFIAGRWHHGALAAPLPDDMAQRNVLIDAFRVAADAATAASNSFAKQGDTEASSFYATQARLLRDQMD